MELSGKLKDHVLLLIFKFLKSLYVDNNFDQLKKIMELLEIKSMYPNLENLAKQPVMMKQGEVIRQVLAILPESKAILG